MMMMMKKMKKMMKNLKKMKMKITFQNTFHLVIHFHYFFVVNVYDEVNELVVVVVVVVVVSWINFHLLFPFPLNPFFHLQIQNINLVHHLRERKREIEREKEIEIDR